MQSLNTDLAADLQAYAAAARRDSKQEQALLRRIRALPQPERMEVLAPLLNFRGWIALSLADRAQLSRRDYLAILKRGLEEADASSIQLWLKATARHLGWQRVFAVLRDMVAPWPCRGALALYHLPYIFGELFPLPLSLNREFVQLLGLYDQQKPLPFLPDSWRNRSRAKNKRPFVFVWDGRQIRSTEFDVKE